MLGHLGWERSILSHPTDGERPTPDGIGRRQTFEGGVIVWHPDLGVSEVRGAILRRYEELGATAWGYPTTDQSWTPDGDGRYNNFRHLATGAEMSIYWTAETGAHEVAGPIREHWVELGWECSELGYPTGPPAPWPDEPGGLQQPFQHGRLLYAPADDPADEPRCSCELFDELEPLVTVP